MKKWIRGISLSGAFEFLAPYCVSIPFTVLCFFTMKSWGNAEKFNKLVEATLSVQSILLGFLGASLAILVAVDDKPVIRKLKEAKKFSSLVHFFFEATLLVFVTILLTFSLVWIDVNWGIPWMKNLVTGWIFGISSSFAVFGRVLWLLFKVLSKDA